MRASRLAVDDEGERVENSIRNAMGAISGLSFAVEREGHATDGLGIAAAVTAHIPIVGLFVSLAATAAAVGTGIAAEVREKEFAEMTQTIRERIKEACGWSCIFGFCLRGLCSLYKYLLTDHVPNQWNNCGNI
jgi:hypothetical protein